MSNTPIPREEFVAHYTQMQKLKELGVIFPFGHFMWVEKKRVGWQVHFPGINTYDPKHMLPAPTVFELLTALPHFITVRKIKAGNVLTHENYPDLFAAMSEDEKQKEKLGACIAHHPAKALADMLITVLESKEIPVQEVNERLNPADQSKKKKV